jgi:methylenetetrahydrofolate reductase (NADPH)
MSFVNKLRTGQPTLSCEFLPPRNSGEWSTLYQTMGRIARLSPDFVSVTYGAGGSTREKTVDLVARIEKELEVEAVAHLTCVGHSVAEIEQILATLKGHNVHAIMALRGDAPKGADRFEAHSEGFAHACDLISLARRDLDLTIGCAFYPEKHLEAESLDSDIFYLKMKQDCGADFAASQIFFDNESFFKFRDLASKAGITMPLVAGILPATSRGQVRRISSMCGTIIPPKLQNILDLYGEGDSIKDAGIAFASEQCAELLDNGAAGIHLYTFNLSNSSVKVITALRALGHFPIPADASSAAAD